MRVGLLSVRLLSVGLLSGRVLGVGLLPVRLLSVRRLSGRLLPVTLWSVSRSRERARRAGLTMLEFGRLAELLLPRVAARFRMGLERVLPFGWVLRVVPLGAVGARGLSLRGAAGRTLLGRGLAGDGLAVGPLRVACGVRQRVTAGLIRLPVVFLRVRMGHEGVLTRRRRASRTV